MKRHLVSFFWGLPLLALLLSSAEAGAAARTCKTEACFVKQVALCKPATFDTPVIAGGQGRYSVYGPWNGGCGIDFEYIKNTDPVLAGAQLAFMIYPNRDIEPQLKEAVAECLKGKESEYRCSGALWEMAIENNKFKVRTVAEPPCGLVVEDQGPPLYAMPRDGKWGYITRDGSWAIAPRWAQAEPFQEGRATVRNTEKYWGVIDRTGAYVLEPVLQQIRPFSEGCAAAEYFDEHSRYTFVARDGSFWNYDTLPEGETKGLIGFGDFSEGKAWFQIVDFGPEDNEFGWIDTTGKVVIPRQYSGGGNFVSGLVPAAQRGNFWALMDEAGNPRIPDRWRFDKMGPMSEGLVAIRIDVFTWYYMSAERIAITKIGLKDPDRTRKGAAGEHDIISKAGAFHDGLAAVVPKWGYLGDERLMFIRPDGSEAFAPERDLGLDICSIDPLPEYQNGLVRLKVSNGDCENPYHVYLDTSGKIVLEEPWRDGDTDVLP